MAGSGFGSQIPHIGTKFCHEVSEVIFASLRFIAHGKIRRRNHKHRLGISPSREFHAFQSGEWASVRLSPSQSNPVKPIRGWTSRILDCQIWPSRPCSDYENN